MAMQANGNVSAYLVKVAEMSSNTPEYVALASSFDQAAEMVRDFISHRAGHTDIIIASVELMAGEGARTLLQKV